LRADCESYSKKARELEGKLKQLSQELEPAKEQARISQAELEASKGQLNRLEEESRKWQERNSQLLSEVERQKVELQQADSERQAVIDSHTAKVRSLLQFIIEHSRCYLL
jgi:nucleoprotein TPR